MQKLLHKLPLSWAASVCMGLEFPEPEEEEPPPLGLELGQLFIALGQTPGPLGDALRPALLVCW